MGRTKKKRELEGIELSFGQFWLVYPRKRARLEAFKSFKRIAPNEETLAQIIIGVMRYIRSGEWSDPKFIPYPATFLNQERWKDEVIEHGKIQGSGTPTRADIRRDNTARASERILGGAGGLVERLRGLERSGNGGTGATGLSRSIEGRASVASPQGVLALPENDQVDSDASRRARGGRDRT
jgi:hypothetical protein